MKKKFLPAVFVAVGLLASFLPIISVDVTADDPTLASTMERSLTHSAWAFQKSGAGGVLLGGLALIGIFAGLAASMGFRRALAVPMVVFAGFLGFIASTMVQGFSHTKMPDPATTISSSPGLGLLTIMGMFVAVTFVALYATIKPDLKTA